MKFYEVIIASRAYHSKKPLTYCYDKPLALGQVVRVSLRNKKVAAIVTKQVQEPSYDTKSIEAILSPVALPDKLLELYEWLESYYPSHTGSSLRLFLPDTSKSWPTADIATVHSIPEELPEELPQLTSDQQSVLKAIATSPANSFLLHGETGSGKTRIYAELAKESLQQGKSALLLTPEIGLTTQLAHQLELFLKKPVTVIHSAQTLKQRRDIWNHIATSEEPLVVIGPRSALFAPIGQLGHIIIDEFHDNAYKQEQAPFYVTSRVAAKLAQLHAAKLLLGSATPPVTDYYFFKSKHLPVLTIKKPARQASALKTEVVDLRERSNFSKSPHLSSQLIQAIQNSVNNDEQALIYLNKRGSARLVLCQSCGWESLCPRCDVALTFHGDEHKLVCHTCGLTKLPPSACPECGAAEILYKSIGTKALITEVKRHFPGTRVERFDTDLKKEERLESRYHAIRNGEVDILVGTQLLGKGLDLPRLSTVGIIHAESPLALPDFTARETMYQQLHQIIGRVGRGHRDGTVVVQSFDPESKLLRAAIKKDYKTFTEEEIKHRHQFMYPPFCYLLKLTCTKADVNAAIETCSSIRDTISSLKLPVTVEGPSPAFKERVNSRYRWQLVVKAKQRKDLLHIIDNLPTGCSYDIDPVNLL